jgi:DNA-binding NarL/FixJ family response regulator
MSRERPIARIFIVSEPAIYRDGLRLLLDAELDFRVVGAAADCVQAVKLVRDCRPDILLLDPATPTLPSREVLGALARACPPARIIVLVPVLEQFEIIDALRHGVSGLVLKDVTRDLLFRSIRVVVAGQYWIGHETVADLVRSLRVTAPSGATTSARKNFGLTPRELDMVAALAAGCVNKEIARRFAISEKTVKYHLTNIFGKLGLSNRVELVLFALHHRLVAPGGRSHPLPLAR